MAFSNGFSGDTKSLNYILQTLEAKQVLIPGVTSNPNLQVSAAGEVAYFYTRGASTVSTATAAGVGKKLGAQISYTSSGVTRQDVSLTDAIQIGAVIPYANFATVEASVIADKVVQESLSAANTWNEKAVAFLEAGATNFYKNADGTIVTTSVVDNSVLAANTVYGEIINMKKAFNIANKAKGMKPTAIIVSEAVNALLLQSDEFIRKEQAGNATVHEGIIGRVAGLQVVVSQDMVEDIIMLNAEALAAPVNVKSLVVADATAAGYPGGVIVAGEIGYGFKIGDADLILMREAGVATPAA